MRYLPRESTTQAPAGIFTSLVGPTAAMRSPDTTTVCAPLGGAPVASITVTCVNASSTAPTQLNIVLASERSRDPQTDRPRPPDGDRAAHVEGTTKVLIAVDRNGVADVVAERSELQCAAREAHLQ